MLNLIVVNVGNSRTQLGRFIDDELLESVRLESHQRTEAVQQVLEWWALMDRNASVMIASVNDAVSEPLGEALQDQLSTEIYRIGDDVPVPIGRQLDPETITGVDRLLNAAAAFEKLKTACVIVDAGTAMTVDFVDGDGTFHGGAIIPGARMQLQALHEHTSALPDLELRKPDDEACGRSTSQALLHGAFHGARGAMQRLVERYAEYYGAFPPVVVTGGDAELLFAEEELVDHVVPDLTLLGIAAAARHALAGGEVEGSDGPD